MSMSACLTKLLREGKIDAGRARAAQETYDEIYADLAQSMDPVQAELAATERALKSLQSETLEKRRQALLQARVQAERLKDIQSFGDGSARAMATAATALLDRYEGATFSNVTARKAAILNRAHARMTEVLATFRRNLVGNVRAPAQLDNLVREIFGQNTGDAAAREMAQAWAQTAEWLRTKFNAAGGRIPKRADWGMPQAHDSVAVRKAGFDAWRADILPRLDRAKMIDEVTGAPFSPQGLEAALRSVYDTIATDGFIKLRPGQVGGKKLANRRLDHRFLVFKSADDWLSYQKRFGLGTPFDVMLGHMDGMARDIAALEILGPNPTATLRWLADTVKRQAAIEDAAAGGEAAMNAARKAELLNSAMWGHHTGEVNAPINGKVGRGFAMTRSLLTAAQLGSAALSAITDVAFQRQAARFNGLSTARVLANYFKLLSPGVTENQKLAVRLGLVADGWSQIAAAQQRYVGEVSGPEWSRRLSDGVLRLSGLSPWTQAGRWAFGMEFLGHLGDMAGKTFAELEPPLQRALERYRIGASAWDTIRATDLYRHEGAAFLRPEDVAARTDIAPGLADDLATRLLEMVATETNFAVPTASLRGRAALGGAAPAGSLWGEIQRSALMYKSFGVTLIYTHVMRALAQKGLGGKASSAANLIIATTLFGALALQMKQIAAGKDPRPMDDGEFWGAAMLQGGGFGIFGDFLFSDVNRFGGSAAVTLMGPVVQLGDDVRKLTVGNIMQLPGDDPTNAGREATNFVRRYLPGGSIWYARLALNRIVFDELQKELDPNYAASFRRMEARARNEFDQDFWWRPGETSPDRAPDFENALEGN
jgi:hypothetical protein